MDATAPISAGEGPVRWVSPAWLADHHEDELLILDCQPNIHEYVSGHLPGAIYLNDHLFRNHEGISPTAWINREAAAWVLRPIGLDADVPVVVYTGSGAITRCETHIGDGLEQTMVAYSLLRYGHGDIRILDGGLDAWRADGYPVTREYSRARESEFEPRVRNPLFVDYDEFVGLKDLPDTVVLDNRPPDKYQGQGPWLKPGHIPGAVSLPWKTLMTPENTRKLRPISEIRAAAQAVGATPDRMVISSCGTGREATNAFLTFRYLLGYPRVRLYEGSFTDWISHPENTTVTGPNPR
jgi:thiosulfate/3-mercaptopyruvate sulfurtransferase